MKNLIFLLISFLCLANAQQKADSIEVVKMAKALEQKNEQNKKDIQEIRKTNKENESLLELVFQMFRKRVSRTEIERPDPAEVSRNNIGTKAENRTDPVEEIEVYDGTDKVRGSWLYRLFHKDDYYLKRYKIVNNEKVYLD